MGKPSHKDYKLYRATIGLTSKDGDEHAFDSRNVIAVDAKDAMAQLTDLEVGEYVSALTVLHTLEGVRFPDPN